jgi:hypothetical protein
MHDLTLKPTFREKPLKATVALLLPQGPGTDTGACVFLSFCSTFRSGGTRIRTGDTMIFSLGTSLVFCIVICQNVLQMSTFYGLER